MEQAVRVRQDGFEPDPHQPRASPAGAGTPEAIDKVLRFAAQARPGDAQPQAAAPMTVRDFATAMDIVREAAGVIKGAEDRARDAEGRIHAIAQRAAEELKNAELRIQSLENRLRSAEGRAADAEARAAEADAWLRQIFTTIADEFPIRRG